MRGSKSVQITCQGSPEDSATPRKLCMLTTSDVKFPASRFENVVHGVVDEGLVGIRALQFTQTAEYKYKL